jgi:citrate lyase subunit beta/citryl-CoA lyase
MTIRPRRTVLYVPGTNSRALDKARTLPVDAVILDLEDSVAPEAKAAARAQVTELVASGALAPREVVVRINGLDTEWWLADVNAIAKAKPAAILLPKVSNTRDLEHVAERLIDISADHSIRIWAMMETPLAVLYAREIAAAAVDVETRLDCLVMGTNDLAKETRAKILPGREAMRLWLMNCVAAARAYGLDIVDGVYADIGDAEGFARECAEACDMGFDGKTIIHPAQVEAANAAFAPTADDVTQARAIIAAFARPENQGRGVIVVDGRMVERLHADIAQRTLTIADAIAARAA